MCRRSQSWNRQARFAELPRTSLDRQVEAIAIRKGLDMAEIIERPVSRGTLLKAAGATGAGLAFGGLLSASKARASGVTQGDIDILIAAEIAEALAVTTYSNIISRAPFFKHLEADDQGYLQAARQEEMSHYLLEQSVTGKPSPYTHFYYPKGMFVGPHVTLNTLVSLEDAFIAAYLVGVRNFSTADLRVTAARIMGIESDHRTLARVVAPGVASQDGGPIEWVMGIQGHSESVDPPNNNGYERTLLWTSIGQAVDALLPFVDKTAAAKAGFNTAVSFPFVPFTPHLPTPLGAFHGFGG